jgi:hypothetical protein
MVTASTNSIYDPSVHEDRLIMSAFGHGISMFHICNWYDKHYLDEPAVIIDIYLTNTISYIRRAAKHCANTCLQACPDMVYI